MVQESELRFRTVGLRTVGLWADIGSISARSRPDFGAGGSAGNRRNLPPRNQAEIEPKSSRYRPKVPQYEVPQYEVPQYEVPQYEVPQSRFTVN